ncbi:MAG: hypothetical protein DMG30_16680 [Acidobacteria bacterium]|nr:MAG: hypothetical protein DMG30_16680 [Acidobacteriota bacterium]
MGFKKATVLASLLIVCFVLAAQSAKAESILFDDGPTKGDSPTLTGSSRLVGVFCGVDICTATLLAPTNAFSTFTGTLAFYLGEGSLTGNISDDFIGAVGSVAVTLKFDSDLPTTAGETTNLGPCVIANIRPGCNAIENGQPQTGASVTWSDGTTDTFYIVSEVGEGGAVVPEPGSMILLGSGLAIAGGFLRRRRGLVTPSV